MYIPIHLNSNGDGPETNEDLIVETLHEVWDENFNKVVSADTEERARILCKQLNDWWDKYA